MSNFNSSRDYVLDALRPVLQGDSYELVRAETDSMLPSSDPYVAVETAVQQLVAENKISTSLSLRLIMGLTTARISGNNRALVEAVDSSRNEINIADRPTPVMSHTIPMADSL
jgi:hypothetical protein